jgi:hypothetical protein
MSAAQYTVPWNKTGIHNEEMDATAYGMGLEEKLVLYSPALSSNVPVRVTYH